MTHITRHLRQDFVKRKELLRKQLEFVEKHPRSKKEPYKINLQMLPKLVKETTHLIIEDKRITNYIKSKRYSQDQKIEYISNYILKKNNNNYAKAEQQLKRLGNEIVNKSRSYNKLLNRFVPVKFKQKSKKEIQEIKMQLQHDFTNHVCVLKSYLDLSVKRLEEINKKRVRKK